jgi:hypothetical protein
MGTESGSEASKSQKAGALFALERLEQLDFALALLAPLWSQRELSSEAAVWLIDRALRSNNPRLQNDAATILFDNAALLWTDTGIEFPQSVSGRWDSSLPIEARFNVLNALLEALLSVPPAKWQKEPLAGAIFILHTVRETETDDTIRANAIVALDALLCTEYVKGTVVMGQEVLRLEKLRVEIGAAASTSRKEATDDAVERSDRLRDYTAQGSRDSKP